MTIPTEGLGDARMWLEDPATGTWREGGILTDHPAARIHQPSGWRNLAIIARLAVRLVWLLARRQLRRWRL